MARSPISPAIAATASPLRAARATRAPAAANSRAAAAPIPRLAPVINTVLSCMVIRVLRGECAAIGSDAHRAGPPTRPLDRAVRWAEAAGGICQERDCHEKLQESRR